MVAAAYSYGDGSIFATVELGIIHLVLVTQINKMPYVYPIMEIVVVKRMENNQVVRYLNERGIEVYVSTSVSQIVR